MRWFGIWIMAGAVMGLGLWAAECVNDRLEILRIFRQMIYHLKNRILYANATLPEALEEIGIRFSVNRSGIWKEPGMFFLRVSEEIQIERNKSFSELWDEKIGQISNKVPLGSEDRKNLHMLGENLGYADREMQERIILFYLEQTDDTIETLRRETAVQGKLYRYLGAAGGLFLVILLS